MKRSFELIIKLNENPHPNDCPMCGEITNPNVGAEIFLAETESVVCLECASKHAPILAGLLTFADLARLFQTAETMFGETWEKKLEFRRIPMNSFGFDMEAGNVG